MGGNGSSTTATKDISSYQHSTTDQSTTYNNQYGEHNIRGGNVGAGATIGLQNMISSIPSYASLHPTTKAPTPYHSQIAGLDLAGYHPTTHTTTPTHVAPAYHAPTTTAPAHSSFDTHANTIYGGINALAGAGQAASSLWGNYNTMKSNDLQAQQMQQMQQMQAQMQAMQQQGYQVPHAIVMLIWWPL